MERILVDSGSTAAQMMKLRQRHAQYKLENQAIAVATIAFTYPCIDVPFAKMGISNKVSGLVFCAKMPQIAQRPHAVIGLYPEGEVFADFITRFDIEIESDGAGLRATDREIEISIGRQHDMAFSPPDDRLQLTIPGVLIEP